MQKRSQIAQLEQQVQWLMSQIRLAKHKQFGVSSERTDDSQLTIFNEAELNSDMTMPEPDFTEVKSHYRKRTRLTTDKLPKDLPVEVIEHKLPVEDCICPECGNEMHTMGKETREELKIIPARAVIVRHVQHVYACRSCETTSDHVPIIKANMPNVIKVDSHHRKCAPYSSAKIHDMASPYTVRNKNGSKRHPAFPANHVKLADQSL